MKKHGFTIKCFIFADVFLLTQTNVAFNLLFLDIIYKLSTINSHCSVMTNDENLYHLKAQYSYFMCKKVKIHQRFIPHKST